MVSELQLDVLNKRNSVDYKSVNFIKEFGSYSKRVDNFTRKTRKSLVKTGYCYYTGIRFADEEETETNVNNPRKRTVDHKISTWKGFIEGIPAKVIGRNR